MKFAHCMAAILAANLCTGAALAYAEPGSPAPKAPPSPPPKAANLLRRAERVAAIHHTPVFLMFDASW